MFGFFRRKPPPPKPIRHPFSFDAETGPVEIEATADGVQLVGPAGMSSVLRWERIDRVRLFGRLIDRRFALPNHTLYCCSLELESGGELTVAHALLGNTNALVVNADSYRAFLETMHRRIVASGATPSFETGPPRWPFHYLQQAENLSDAVQIFESTTHLPWIAAALVGIGVIPAFANHAPWTKLRFRWRNRTGVYKPHRLPSRLLPPV